MARFDPLQAFCFSVSLQYSAGGGGAVAFCKSVSGLKAEREVIPFKEGGNNIYTHKLVGPANHPNIVLKRGFVSSTAGEVFAQKFFQELLADKVVRLSGSIVQLGPDLKPRWEWKFKEGWICKWEGPDLDASKSELAFESIEIAHHGFELIPAGV